MTDPQQPQQSPACPRCGTPSGGHAWCQKCGLNLRMPFQAESAAQRPEAPLPSTPFARAWERATRTTDPMVVAGVAVVIAVAAVIVAIVVATKGHGDGGQLSGVAAVSTIPVETTPVDSTPTESTPTETTAATPTVEAPQVEHVLGEYTRDYSNEDLEGLRSLFAESLERHDGSRAPEDLTAAVATYEHQFGELQKPTYSLSETSVEPGSGEASATARYSITSQNGTVTGSITFHLVEQNEKLLIDKLTIEPSQ
ncbi:MAG: hypothetical protein ACRDLF_01215 [Solirubrobacteraceae bacterium]